MEYSTHNFCDTLLYHGSGQIVEKPRIMTDGFYKDFGFGFYCTVIEKQAHRWALTKSPRPTVNVYQYTPDLSLNIQRFANMSEEWLDFVTECRRGITHSYDIVEGPMADDTVWNYVEDFAKGEISRTAFWELVKFKYPTHQIVFCTKDSLKTIKYLKEYAV